MPRTREDLWARLRIDPGYAPELLAEAAVEAYGPQARAWVDRMRLVYPAATATALARLATAEHTRLAATTGGLSALANPLAPLAGAAGLAGLQARLVLRIAAAHGADPTAPERAIDLLVLTGVQPDAERAREALAAAGKPSQTQPGRSETLRRAGPPLVRTLTVWLGLRALARLVPGSAVALGATAGADATRALAARAVQHYRHA